MANVQQETPQCVSMLWSDGREIEVGQIEYCEEMELETRGWRCIAYCEWAALPPVAMASSQSKLPLRATSGSITIQQQGSLSRAHITTKEHGDIPGWEPSGCPGAV